MFVLQVLETKEQGKSLGAGWSYKCNTQDIETKETVTRVRSDGSQDKQWKSDGQASQTCVKQYTLNIYCNKLRALAPYTFLFMRQPFGFFTKSLLTYTLIKYVHEIGMWQLQDL